MGIINTISATRWPKQGSFLGKRVEVCFHYDTSHRVKGTIVRDDDEEPYTTIINLDSGHVVLSTECQFTLINEKDPR